MQSVGTDHEFEIARRTAFKSYSHPTVVFFDS